MWRMPPASAPQCQSTWQRLSQTSSLQHNAPALASQAQHLPSALGNHWTTALVCALVAALVYVGVVLAGGCGACAGVRWPRVCTARPPPHNVRMARTAAYAVMCECVLAAALRWLAPVLQAHASKWLSRQTQHVGNTLDHWPWLLGGALLSAVAQACWEGSEADVLKAQLANVHALHGNLPGWGSAETAATCDQPAPRSGQNAADEVRMPLVLPA
jgi:hypothetical protein